LPAVSERRRSRSVTVSTAAGHGPLLCAGKRGEGREDGGGATIKLSSDEARVGRVRMGTAELQGDRGAGRSAEASRDLVEGPHGHVDIIDRHEHILLLGK
jgi:hypothetical protein